VQKPSRLGVSRRPLEPAGDELEARILMEDQQPLDGCVVRVLPCEVLHGLSAHELDALRDVFSDTGGLDAVRAHRRDLVVRAGYGILHADCRVGRRTSPPYSVRRASPAISASVRMTPATRSNHAWAVSFVSASYARVRRVRNALSKG